MAALGRLQPHDTTRAVYSVPSEPERLPATKAGEQGELHEVGEGRVATLASSVQQPPSFIGGQPPQAALRLFLKVKLRDLRQHVQLATKAQHLAQQGEGTVDRCRT